MARLSFAIIIILFVAAQINAEDKITTGEDGLYMNLFDEVLIVQVDEESVRLKTLEFVNKTAKAMCDEKKPLDITATTEKLMSRLKTAHKERKGTNCDLIKNKLTWIMEPWVNAVDACGDGIKGGPKFLIKAIVSLTDTVCQMQGEQLIELTNPCIYKSKFTKCIPTKTEFLTNLTANKKTTEGYTVKNEICGEYEKARSCLEKEINESCKVEMTKQGFMAIADAIFKTPC